MAHELDKQSITDMDCKDSPSLLSHFRTLYILTRTLYPNLMDMPERMYSTSTLSKTVVLAALAAQSFRG